MKSTKSKTVKYSDTQTNNLIDFLEKGDVAPVRSFLKII